MLLTLELVICEFGQLPGAEQARRIDHERRQHLVIPMLARVYVEHEIDEGALEPGARAPINRETGTGDFGRALQIQNAQFRAEIPVRFGLEIKLSWLAAAPH